MSPSARNQYPDGHVLYRLLAKSFPKIVRGEGCWLYDDTGKKYLDASSGALVANLGHGNAELAKAIGEQAARVGYVNGVAFTNDAVEELATELTALTADGLDKAMFCCNGGDAVEAALQARKPQDVFEGRELALLQYAEKLTLRPGEMIESDVAGLKAQATNGIYADRASIMLALPWSIDLLKGMSNKRKKIALIGAGNIGGTLTTCLTNSGLLNILIA